MNGSGAFPRCDGTDVWHVKGDTETWGCPSMPTTRFPDGRTFCDLHARTQLRKASA